MGGSILDAQNDTMHRPNIYNDANTHQFETICDFIKRQTDTTIGP